MDAIQQAAGNVVHPDRLVWVVVGDREQIERGLREPGYGTIEVLDTDGNLVSGPAWVSGAERNGFQYLYS